MVGSHKDVKKMKTLENNISENLKKIQESRSEHDIDKPSLSVTIMLN